MPNARSKDKKYVSAEIRKSLYDSILKKAKSKVSLLSGC